MNTTTNRHHAAPIWWEAVEAAARAQIPGLAVPGWQRDEWCNEMVSHAWELACQLERTGRYPGGFVGGIILYARLAADRACARWRPGLRDSRGRARAVSFAEEGGAR